MSYEKVIIAESLGVPNDFGKPVTFLDFYKPSTVHRHRWSIGESEKVFRRTE